MYFSYTGAKLRKKEGEKILLFIFGFKICVVVFNRIMCCYAETGDLVISRVFSPGNSGLWGWDLQRVERGSGMVHGDGRGLVTGYTANG